METNIAAGQCTLVQHSDSSNLNGKNQDEINTIENSHKQKNLEVSECSAIANENVHEANQRDDQESVIIEEVENKTIELNDDSDEDLQSYIEQSKDSSNKTKSYVSKTTDLVILNTAADGVHNTGPINRYAIDDVKIKDELSESITVELSTNDVLENDPMDLLELNNRSESTSSTRSQDDSDDYGDDVSSVGSSSNQTASTSTVSTLGWIKKYPWLLYEEGDELFGYCLYCDVNINTKSQRFVKQHGLSLYHKERCENYLAFQDEEERNGQSMQLVEIKEEYGTDSRVEALKLKRKSQSEALVNFNWRRWLENYPWLERDSHEGTVGFCKYCLMHVNVEFSYLRDRHQEGGKHREAEKYYEQANEHAEQNKSFNSNEEKDKEPDDNSQSRSQKWMELVANEPTMARCKLCRTKMFKNNFLRHLRTNLHDHNEKIYLQNHKSSRPKELLDENIKIQHSWKLYTKHHPWLTSDPVDPTFAYCKYCERRIIYGTSASKRATHENSSQHKHNESVYKNNSRKVKIDKNHNEAEAEQDHDTEDHFGGDDVAEDDEENNDESGDNNEQGSEYEDYGNKGDEDEDDEAAEEEEEVAEEEKEAAEEEEGEVDDEGEVDKQERAGQREKESEEENESKKRIYKLSDEWIDQYSWCIRYKKDPTNFIYCIYCKIPLKVSYSRTKHQFTSFHISAEKEFLEREAKKQNLQESSPFSEWAVPLKNNPSSYSCRYCRVRISKHYSKKQHESSKIHQINENIYKKNSRRSLRRDENSNCNVSEQTKVVAQQPNVESAKKVHSSTKVVIKSPSIVTLIKQYQKKFTWLSYKRSELRSNYGHCKVCDNSLYIRSLKHILRHQRSGRHVRIIKANKRVKLANNLVVNATEMSETIIRKGSKEELPSSPAPIINSSHDQTKLLSTTTTTTTKAIGTHTNDSQNIYNYKSTISEMRKRFSWIEKSETANYAFCRFCNANIPLKIIFLRNHSNSQQHRHCVTNYYSIDGKNAEERNNAQEGNSSKCDDVMIVEDNNEEILISEQDENWSIKSEVMDEHEELDYLLQRSFNHSQHTLGVRRNIHRNANAESDPPAKRIKRSHSFKRLNESNSSLVASLLTTPLTLASCLGPLIQQQIQQQTNVSQISQTKTNASPPTAIDAPRAAIVQYENTYDLFFKSISETMKKLPADLAAEGKLRVMQIICDLELQALKRQSSARSESDSSNTSGGFSNHATSTCTSTHPVCNSTSIYDAATDLSGNGNETMITQLIANTGVSSPSSTSLSTNTSSVEKPATSNSTSSVIGIMEKNGLQALHLKAPVSKQIPFNTAITTNSGIRCIPFKNLSQTATTDPSNSKITRIQVPITVPTQTTANPNTSNTQKNLINLRNIQITKRITTPPNASPTATTVPQQTVQQTPTMANKNSQMTFITNIQPQLQRWGCSVNGTTSHHTPTSSTVNHAQQTSTPISNN